MSLDFAARSYAANTQNLIWEHAALLKSSDFHFISPLSSQHIFQTRMQLVRHQF